VIIVEEAIIFVLHTHGTIEIKLAIILLFQIRLNSHSSNKITIY
jgi:hypothetical protein